MSLGSEPHLFTFILKPINVPLYLDFKVKTFKGAALALAENRTEGAILAEISRYSIGIHR